MTLRVTPKQVQEAKHCDLTEFICLCGYQVKNKTENEKYLIEPNGDKHNSFVISNNKWCWHSRGGIGGTAIDFILKVYEPDTKTFQEAVLRVLDILGKGHGDTEKGEPLSKGELDGNVEKVLKLPEKNENQYRVIAYLTKTRGINPDIVKDYIKLHKLYEDTKHNAVFVGYDMEGRARAAFKRGTLSDVKYTGDCEGSSKNYGFAMEGTSNKLYTFESAIDAMSHASLAMLRGEDYTQDHRIAQAGTSVKAVLRYLKDHPGINEVIMANDRDKAGFEAMARIADALRETRIKLSAELPMNKDFNDDLREQIRKLKEGAFLKL